MIEKQIDGFPDYYVHPDGYVISKKSRNPVKMIGSRPQKGYQSVSLRYEGVQVQKLIHRLVAEYFIPRVNGKNQVNHIDGNKQNNSVSNLEWVSPKENMKHAVEKGLWTAPTDEQYIKNRLKSNQTCAKFTVEEASDIAEMKEVLGLSFKETAEIVGCSINTVKNITRCITKYYKNGIIAE